MFSLGKILVPLDGSDNSFRALDVAIYLAQKSNSVITVLYSISIFPNIEFQTIDPIQCQVEERKFAESVLQKAESICKQNNVVTTNVISHGTPGYVIVTYASDHKIDLIVIGSRGRSTIKEVFLGGVSNYVLHKSTIPVLIVK